MSSDSDKFNRRRSSDNPKSNVVDAEVRKLFKQNPNNIDQKTMYKLREKYDDQEILDQIQETFIERSREIRKKAKKFAKLINERYSNQNYPLHILLKKALKYKKKYSLSDAEFSEFRRIYEQTLLVGHETKPQTVNVTVPFTNLSRTLGQGVVDVDDGMKIKDQDYDDVQQVIRLYNETKTTHAQVVLQSMTYQDLDQIALSGDFKRAANNPHCHVHPVIAALFLPKIKLLEEHLLHANISYIVKQRYTKQPILTSTDYDLFYDLISDPTDIVCSNQSAVKDLHTRSVLQHHLWNSVLFLRNGKYYDCNNNNFNIAVDNCRRTVADNPDLIYEGDEGTVMQRVLGAFSVRPTIVSTTPLYSLHNNTPMGAQHTIPKVSSLAFLTLKVPSRNVTNPQNVSLESALNQSQWYVEDGVVVPRNQSVIYSRDVIVFYVPRRAATLNFGKLLKPRSFHRLPRTVAGFDRLNNMPINYQDSITVNDTSVFQLRSVVICEVGPKNIDVQGAPIITGASACIWARNTLANGQPNPDAGKIYWYNPLGAAKGYANLLTQAEREVADGNPGHHSFYNRPIGLIDSLQPYNNYEDAYTKASQRGTVFIYEADGEHSKPNSLMHW